MEGNIVRNKVIAFLILMLLCLAGVVLSTSPVSAITTYTIPSDNTIVPESYKLNMGSSNATVTINSAYADQVGVYGSSPVEYTLPRNTGGTKVFTNLMTVDYTNAGEINGRKINIRLNIDRLEQTGSTSANVTNGSGAFLSLWGDETQVSSYKTNTTRYKHMHTVDFSIRVTYADTGEVVNLPFFMRMQDIDVWQNVSPITEGWVPKTGFTKAYIYPSCWLLQQDGGFFARKDLAYMTDGTDSIIKAGVYGATTNGSFTFRNYVTNCRTAISIFSQYKKGVIPTPTLEIDDSHVYEEGSEVVLNVKQKIGTYFVDTINDYTNFIIKDDVPAGLTYKSARVLDASGNDVTSKGTLKYDTAKKTVTFTFAQSFLATQNSYNGSVYTLEIKTTADPITGGSKTISDTAGSEISTIGMETNKKSIKVVKPYHVTYSYVSGTEGKSLPADISTEKGEYKISDDGTYYQDDTVTRKDYPADGESYEIWDKQGDLAGQWILSWDAASNTVSDGDISFVGTWRYVPEPRLVIEKKLTSDDANFLADHGEVTFLFKITGADSGKSWYKSISFTQETLDAVRNGEEITDSDRTTFTVKDGYIYATCKAIHLPEDDYTVKEVNVFRFKEVSAMAEYYGAQTKTIGTSTGDITVPLKLSTYKAGDPGYDAAYAKVLFENTKARWDKYTHNDYILNENSRPS